MTTKVPVELSSTPGIVDGSNATAITIDSSENIGFNTTDVTVGSSVSGSSTATPKFITYNNNYSSGYTDASLKLYLFNQGTTRQGFTSGPAFDLQYHSSGSANGRHAFYVANTEELRIDQHGIKFNGDTAAANALDDYEEGTFTPTFSGATLSTAVGFYTKIGNQVTVHYRIVTTGGLPSSGSQVQIGGLPFAISSATSFGGAGSVYVGPSNVSSATGGGGTIVSFASGGESVLRYVNVDTGTLGYTLMGELEVSANNVVTAIGTHTYQV